MPQLFPLTFLPLSLLASHSLSLPMDTGKGRKPHFLCRSQRGHSGSGVGLGDSREALRLEADGKEVQRDRGGRR
jgi:hypothetical protein